MTKTVRTFLGLMFLATQFSRASYQIVHQSADTLEISIYFAAPEVSSQSNSSTDMFSYEKEEVVVWTEGPVPRVETVSQDFETLPLTRPARYTEDIPIGLSEQVNEFKILDVKSLQVRALRSEGSRTLWQIVLYPSAPSDLNRELLWVSRWQLRLIGSSLTLEKGSISPPIVKQTSLAKTASVIKPDRPRIKRLKMWIREEGMFILPRDAIINAGFDIRNVDPKMLRVTGMQGEVPIRVIGEQDGRFDAADYIEFWGEPLWNYQANGEKRLDPFAIDNIYWLEIGDTPGLRMGQESGTPAYNASIRPAGRSFLYTEHFERDLSFQRLPWQLNMDEGDHWFYTGVIGGEKREVSFETRDLDTYSIQLAQLTIHLRGNSSNSLPQPIAVYLNEHLVIPEQTLLNEKKTFVSEGFSPMFLKEGENILTLVNRSTEQELSQVFLDWFEISYPRLYLCADSSLKFNAPAYSEGRTIRFEIDDFSDDQIDVYKLGNSHIYGQQVESYKDTLGVTKYRVIFQDEIRNSDEEYFAVGHNQKRLPDSLQTVVTPDLKGTSLNADFVVIIPHDSLGGTLISPLLAQRKKQGLRCAVVSLDTLYDNFSNGIPTPKAIQLFLNNAYQTWQTKPRFCLLIGDGFYSMRITNEKSNLMPFFHYQTYKYGAAASDYYFTLLDGNDELPDIAIGRLPIHNRAELQTVIEKIVTYETSPPDLWKNHYLMIASDRQTGTFGVQTESLIQDVLPKSMEPGRLFLQGSLSDPNVGGTEDLLRQLEDGVSLVNFRGHGGGAIWADAGLLDLDDIELIENRGRLPVMTSMTCFTADFASSRRSLGEDLICHEEIGAIAFLGASGVGWVYNDYYLISEIYALIEAHPEWTIGELIQYGERNFLLKNPGDIAISSVYQYSLLGDPAIRLTFPETHLDIQLENPSVSANAPLRIQGVENLSPGEIHLEGVGADGNALTSRDFEVDTLPFQAELPFPSGNTLTGVRAYAWNSQTGYQANGYIPIQIGKAYFDSTFTIPTVPTARDTLYFAASVHDYSAITQAWCLIFAVNQDSLIDSLAMTPQGETSIYKTVRGLTGLAPGSVLRYAVFTLDEDQTHSSSDTVVVRIPTLPDLSISELLLSGTETSLLTATVHNYGGEPVKGARVRLKSQVLGIETDAWVDVPGYGQADISIPFLPIPGTFQVEGTVSVDAVAESNLQNNSITRNLEMDQFNVTPQTGTGGWIGYQNLFECIVPQGCISAPTVLKISRNDFSQLNSESTSATGPVYHLQFLANPQITSNFQIRFYRGDADTAKTGKPYRWDTSLRQWIYQPFTNQDSLVLFDCQVPGLFQLMNAEDDTPPQIEIQVDNQPFTARSYVPKQARFSVLISDDSGVDPRRDALKISLDDRRVPPESLIVPDSVSQNRTLLVMFDVDFNTGSHQIRVEASDIHGNQSIKDPMDFQVAGSFALQYLGNHPNPFRRETVFVYVLTDIADRASLKIYTVSGRLIRSFEDAGMSAPDYHELLWDGTDTWGDEVANGVYFFRLKASQDDRKEEITGKIAKVR